MRRLLFAALLAAGCASGHGPVPGRAGGPASGPSAAVPVPGPGERLGYIRDVADFPPETAEAREARHRRVAERRANVPLVVHRGAWKFAPENTLEAFAASIDHGGDGSEIDIHRTKDGVLALNHDAAVHRTLLGEGLIRDLTYFELLAFRYREPKGADRARMRIPTFAAVLLLARERAMLLHLDIKVPGIDGEMARMIDEADVWDHVVMVNEYNSETIRAHPKLRRIRYKGSFNEPPDVLLKRPGEMIFVEADPTGAAQALGRPIADKAEPLPPGVWRVWTEAGPAAGR